jgi:hypothetical protein
MLQAADRSKALAHSLAFSKRNVRILCSIVQAFVRTMLDVWNDLTPCCAIGAQLVGDHPLRHHALLLHQTYQQSPGRLGIAAVLDNLIEHKAVVVNRPPQPASLAVDAHRDFIKVPDIIAGRRLSADTPSIFTAMFSAPPTDSLIRRRSLVPAAFLLHGASSTETDNRARWHGR